MSGPACKIILNGGVWGLSDGIRQILTDPNINMGFVPEKIRKGLLDRLARIDVAAMTGGQVPVYGLGGIMVQLEDYGLISPDVWEIFVRPTIDSNVNFKVTEDYQIDSA